MNTKSEKKTLAGQYLVKAIQKSLIESKAEKVTIINLKKLPGATDYFIIAESDNDAHVRACANAVIDDLAEKNTKPWQREGLEEGRWVLLDYSDVVVHVMLADLRSYYNLEEIWSDGVVKQVEETWGNKEDEA